MGYRSNKRTIKGVVIGDKMDKTVIVRVERLAKDEVFQKYLRRYGKYKAHDENNDCRVGDKIMIIESRPLSREKRWRVKEILERAK